MRTVYGSLVRRREFQLGIEAMSAHDFELSLGHDRNNHVLSVTVIVSATTIDVFISTHMLVANTTCLWAIRDEISKKECGREHSRQECEC